MELGPAEIAALVGVIGAIVGGVGGKAFDNYMDKRKMGMDLASQIRSEQRAEVLTLRSELDNTEEDLDEWREKYYEIKEENVKQQTMMDGLQVQINDMKKLGE